MEKTESDDGSLLSILRGLVVNFAVPMVLCLPWRVWRKQYVAIAGEVEKMRELVRQEVNEEKAEAEARGHQSDILQI